RKARPATPVSGGRGSYCCENGGRYWTRTSGLRRVKTDSPTFLGQPRNAKGPYSLGQTQSIILLSPLQTLRLVHTFCPILCTVHNGAPAPIEHSLQQGTFYFAEMCDALRASGLTARARRRTTLRPRAKMA